MNIKGKVLEIYLDDFKEEAQIKLLEFFKPTADERELKEPLIIFEKEEEEKQEVD
jgi:hypothetical protein